MGWPPVSCDPPTLEETRRAVNQLKSGKAPGGCGIYAEMFKAGGAAALLWLHTLLCSIWNTGIIPTDWRRSVVFPIWKGKGDAQECNIYEGVLSFLYQAKLARIFLDRVCQKVLTHQHHKQFGFTPNKSTVDCTLAVSVLTESA